MRREIGKFILLLSQLLGAPGLVATPYIYIHELPITNNKYDRVK